MCTYIYQVPDTIFHMPICSGCVVVTIKLKKVTKMFIMLLFYFLPLGPPNFLWPRVTRYCGLVHMTHLEK